MLRRCIHSSALTRIGAVLGALGSSISFDIAVSDNRQAKRRRLGIRPVTSRHELISVNCRGGSAGARPKGLTLIKARTTARGESEAAKAAAAPLSRKTSASMDAQAREPGPRKRRRNRLIDLHGKAPDEDLAQFLLEERSRRSFSVTGYLLSGGGAGAVTCWFLIGSLYANKAPALVLRMMIAASGLFLAAVVVGFLAALAGYKAYETAALLPIEELGRPNRADRWMATTVAARIAAALFLVVGGLATFAAYVELAWR
jgi:hypothetical protein